jgi:hypothetical protein
MTTQIVIAILGLVNVYVIFALTRFYEWKKGVDIKLQDLDRGSIPEDRFRKIIQEELQGFELRLIKEGRFEV